MSYIYKKHLTTKTITIFTSKFTKILQTFSEDELKSFDTWLRSPWSNSNKNLIRLLEKIKKYAPNYAHPKLTKEKLFKQILPNGKFSDRRMNNLLSEGYLAAERFMVFQKLAHDQNLQKNLLTKELQNRHLEDWFFRDIEKEIDRLESKEIKDWEDHFDLLQLHRRVYHHPTQSPRMQQGKLTIVKMGSELDLVYLLEKAAIINEKIFRNRILKNENHDVSQELKKWRVASEGVDHPAIDFYKMRFDYNEENMLEKYFELREMFLERFDELNKKDQNTHFSSLINDSVKLIRARVFNITEILPLYKLGLKSELLFQDGVLSHTKFVAALAASNTKKDFYYSNELIEVYLKKIEPYAQVDGLYWAKAHTSYYKGNLNECLDFLLSHDFKVKYFQQITRVLTTQVYFDLYLTNYSYQDYLFNFFDSYEKWVFREKFGSKALKESHLRFVQLCRILAKSYTDVNFNAKKVENLLESETNIQASEWLGRKIETIIKLKKGPSKN